MMEGGHKINFILNQKAIFCMGQAKTLWADHSDPLTFKKVNKSWRWKDNGKNCVTSKCWSCKDRRTYKLDWEHILQEWEYNCMSQAVKGALHTEQCSETMFRKDWVESRETHKDNIVLGDKRKTGLYFFIFIRAFEWKRGKSETAVQCLAKDFITVGTPTIFRWKSARQI